MIADFDSSRLKLLSNIETQPCNTTACFSRRVGYRLQMRRIIHITGATSSRNCYDDE